MTYKERYDEVIASGRYNNTIARLRALAWLHHSAGEGSKADCVWMALEDYEAMTGHYIDPTPEYFDSIL